MTAISATDKLFRALRRRTSHSVAHTSSDRHFLGATMASCFWNTAKVNSRSRCRRMRAAGFNSSLGFGLRAVAGEATGWPMQGKFRESALRRAAASVAAMKDGHSGKAAEPPRHEFPTYSDDNPLGLMEFSARTSLLAEIDAYARRRTPSRPVMASISGEWQAVQIMRADGTRVADLRPLVA